ncbi:hypothetical protein [Oceanobacillus oncorhynchi]|uniref:hypothetical protein n=1 Tax=Oceanobacillus oncorhynchi TaxID=545501 RepID=UPI00186787A4|nr:hypothetical protein [Oceanobacillus oncorhynchi]
MGFIKLESQLFEWTKKHGAFPVWVLDKKGNKYYGDSFDLCLTLANGQESTRLFPCADKQGNTYQLSAKQISNFDMNLKKEHFLKYASFI